MKKNGSYFLSEISRSGLQPGIWNPYTYREKRQTDLLEHFAAVQKIRGRGFPRSEFKYAPIEYRHIPRGTIPTFILEPSGSVPLWKADAVGETCLLFGTMRAYLGNVLVTPRAAWIGEKSPFFFAVKSEFVQVTPKDGLVYFWWAYLQSPSFLQGLPIGTGGTRPRLDPTSMLQTPVEIPVRSVREQIHQQILDYAETAWRQYVSTEHLLTATMR